MFQRVLQQPTLGTLVPATTFLAFLVGAALLFDILGTNIANAGAGNVEVTVKGTGATVEIAKSDAIRQALQLTISQLVVVDREIRGNAVLRDRVLSTMNGYVERFVVRDEVAVSGGFSLTADITVSASRIENFIGLVSSEDGRLDGNIILAEQSRRNAQAQAEILQRKARGELFDNALRDFPSKAISINVEGIKLSDKDPNLLDISVEVSLKPEFADAFEGMVSALSSAKCKTIQRGKSKEARELSSAAHRNTHRVNCTGRGMSVYGAGTHDVVCFADADTIRCYQLATGDYCAGCDLGHFSKNMPMSAFDSGAELKGLVTYGRFVDESGANANRNGDCIHSITKPIWRYPPYGNRYGFLELFIEKVRSRFMAGFDLVKRRGVITISTNNIDLERAKYFVVAGGLVGAVNFHGELPRNVVTSVVPPPSTENGCELLEEAVHIRRLLGFGTSPFDL